MRGAAITFLLAGAVVSGLEFSNHGYNDLLVTISPDLPQDNAATIIENLKIWLSDGSSTLYSSSRGWAFIRNVRILIPNTWTNISVDDTVESIVFKDGNIRVDERSGVYGNSPFTIQTGGCAESGEYIQASAPFLTEYESMNTTFGPLGQVFVHEWAKYRYGVFEEFGFPGDEKYPMFYYKVQWTSSGQENVVTPNFCTNTEITDFSMVDAVTGGECSYSSKTGLPDFNCIPVLGQNNNISSSIMAIPYLEGNDQFCDDTEEMFHRVDIPTKHNDICEGRSTFSVIQDHPDFKDYEPGNQIEDITPRFSILGTKSASSFVMVLDVSGSMDDNCGPGTAADCEYRITRMVQASKRWVEYDIKDGVPLGLVTFSSKNNINEILSLKSMDGSYRQTFKDELDKLKADGGTCMGDGLLKGLETLKNGNVPYGGVILFLTDGEFTCDGGIQTLDEVIPDLKAQGVRVITIAFSDDADENIINLARETNGKSYFVPDSSGPELINTAMQGSLTYQPSVPSNEIDIIIFEESFEHESSIKFNITVDDLIGRNVTVQIDMSGNPGSLITIGNNTAEAFDADGTFQYVYLNDLVSGSYSGQIEAQKAISFVSIKVTARSNSATVPIMTECWTSFGNNAVDFSVDSDLKLAVIAKVLQGANPVIGAKVTAYIEQEGADAPIELTLYDKGAAPDSIANDGLYARYFTKFEPNAENTRYTLKCQVEGTDDSQINQGFIDARDHMRSLPNRPSSESPVCCGSDALREDSILSPTGNFKRLSSGGSIEMKNANKVDYPPGQVNDLRGGNNLNQASFTLTFTSAGETLDSGTAEGIEVYFSHNSSLLFDNSNLTYLTVNDVYNNASLTPSEAGTKVEIEVKRIINGTALEVEQQYFFRLLTVGKTKSTWSNIAPVYFPRQQVSSSMGMCLDRIILVLAATVFFTKHSF